MSDFLLSQIFVTVTLVLELGAMQLKQRHYVVLILAISSIFNSIHFFLLDQPTAGWIFILSFLRYLLAIRWRNLWLAGTFVGASIALTAITYIGYLSILGLAASVFIIFASFTKSDRMMRLLFFAGGSVWVVHNFLLWTPVGILLEGVFAASAIIGYYRFYVRSPTKANVEEE